MYMQATPAPSQNIYSMQHSQALQRGAGLSRRQLNPYIKRQPLTTTPLLCAATLRKPLRAPNATPRIFSSSSSSGINSSRRWITPHSAMFYRGGVPDPSLSGFGSIDSNYDRVLTAPPAARQALLSNAITSVRDWRQLNALVDRFGVYLTANNISHVLTRLEQLLAGRQLPRSEAVKVAALVDWLLSRGRELNASAQLGPQALGTTAAALARQQQQQRRQQQQEPARQQQQQIAWQQQQEKEEERKQAAAAAERRVLLQQLVDAAVAQRGRLTPQALNSILSALASLEESGMSADEIRQTLNIQQNNKPAKPSRSSSTVRPSGSSSSGGGLAPRHAPAQQQQQQQQQQQGDLRSAARQLGQLSPELAEEWYDRAVRQSLAQGTLPPGIDQRYLSGFLAREIDRTSAKSLNRSSSSSSSRAVSGAALLEGVVRQYGQLMGAGHLALAAHKLTEMQQQGLAGSEQAIASAATLIFSLYEQSANSADASALTSMITSCKHLKLYSKTLVSAILARSTTLMQQQLQQRGLGTADQRLGFSGRQLGVLLHSLAVLGLKPSEAWLTLALATAGDLIRTCSLTDLERLLSSLLLMRIQPGADWTAAAEQHLEQLAAATGSSSSRSGARLEVDQPGDQDEGSGDVDERKTLVACVKALALLGGQRAEYWYRSILADQERQQIQQQQQQQQQRKDGDQRAEQRQAEQARRQQRQQQDIATSDQQLTRQLKKAVAQQQQHKKKHMHLHPQQHVNVRSKHPYGKQDAAASSSSSSSSRVEVPGRDVLPLSSLDDIMSQQLLQQDSNAAATGDGPAAAAAGGGLPDLPTAVPDLHGSSSSSSDQTVRDRDQGSKVESVRSAAWADEQSARWAAAEQQLVTPAAELAQQLDDSQMLFGSSSSSGSSSKRKEQRGGSPAKQQQQQQVPSKEIPIVFENEGSTGSSGSSGEQQQRSDADAASALAALMAEVDAEQVDESAQQDVLRELGLGPDLGPDGTYSDTTAAAAAATDGSNMTIADIQAAADAAAEASQQLDQLQQQQQQQGPAARSANSQQQQQQQGSKHQQHHEHKHKDHKHKDQKPKPVAAAAKPKQQQQQQQGKRRLRPLGASGEAAFTAAAKNLSSSKPSRNYLLGCLEAIDIQRNDLKRKIAEKQALAAVADAARQQRQQQQQRSDPLATKIQQLQQDLDRARKRFEDEKSNVRSAAVAEVVEKLLPLLDSFDAALAAQQQQQQQQQGSSDRDEDQIHLVYQGLNAQLLNILKSQRVDIIGDADGAVVGKPFDPAHMEAVMRQPAPAGFSDGDVLRVLRKGYSVGEKLVRAALVVVAYED